MARSGTSAQKVEGLARRVTSGVEESEACASQRIACVALGVKHRSRQIENKLMHVHDSLSPNIMDTDRTLNSPVVVSAAHGDTGKRKLR